ncbi:MAG: peptidoglycan-binding domain-containing protein [Casimicrobiaceae bacterium]
MLTYPLCIGSSGQQVKTLQALLNEAQPGSMLPLDGRFDKKTHGVLLAFQRQKGLKPDGVVGPKTAKALGWNYQPVDTKPYVIRYDVPPLPAMTPPLAVLADAIWTGMQPFKELILDDIVHAFDGYVNPHASSEQYAAQGRQKLMRYEDLTRDFLKLKDGLNHLKELSAGQFDLAVEEIRDVFAYFKSDMSSALKGMDFYGTNMTIPIRNIESLPSWQISAAIERVMKGEQIATIAIAQVNLALETAKRMWVKSW